MLATLIHSTLISDSQSERDDNKKLYINLMKKLKKELGDKSNASVKFVRQLLPLSKQTCEVRLKIVCNRSVALNIFFYDYTGNCLWICRMLNGHQGQQDIWIWQYWQKTGKCLDKNLFILHLDNDFCYE